MRVDRGRVTQVRSWGRHDPERLEFGLADGRRTRLPIQYIYGHHCSSLFMKYCEIANGVLKMQSEAISHLESRTESTFDLKI
jgi:hypothetical protein